MAEQPTQTPEKEEPPRLKKVIEGANDLSLGISMVVAVLLGVGLGYWMKKTFDKPWLFWLGVFWGVAAAILNVVKAYKKQMKSLQELAEDPRYKNYADKERDEDDS